MQIKHGIKILLYSSLAAAIYAPLMMLLFAGCEPKRGYNNHDTHEFYVVTDGMHYRVKDANAGYVFNNEFQSCGEAKSFATGLSNLKHPEDKYRNFTNAPCDQ